MLVVDDAVDAVGAVAVMLVVMSSAQGLQVDWAGLR